MKATFVMLCLWASVTACQPSKNEVDVPDNVKNAFSQLHPNATGVRWIQEPSIFEAKFTEGDYIGAVAFNEAGNVVETEQVIEQNQLPNLEGILDYINTHYSGEAIQKSEKITKADGSISYELQITGMELIFDAQGNFAGVEPD